MKEIINRFKADTPSFFKKLRNLGLSLTAAGVAIVAIPHVPQFVINAGTQLIWIGPVIAAVSQLACKNPDDLTTK